MRASEGRKQQLRDRRRDRGACHHAATGSHRSYYGYLLWYNVRSIRNNSGASVIPEFRADFYAQAGRIIHTWQSTLFGGVHLGSGVIYLFDYAKVKEGSFRDEDFDISLLNVEPILLSGTVGDWHLYTGVHLYYGVGNYDPTHIANAVVHYAHYPTYTQDAAVTWTPSPWVEASVNTSVSFNMREQPYRLSLGRPAGAWISMATSGRCRICVSWDSDSRDSGRTSSPTTPRTG